MIGADGVEGSVALWCVQLAGKFDCVEGSGRLWGGMVDGIGVVDGVGVIVG